MKGGRFAAQEQVYAEADQIEKRPAQDGNPPQSQTSSPAPKRPYQLNKTTLTTDDKHQ